MVSRRTANSIEPLASSATSKRTKSTPTYNDANDLAATASSTPTTNAIDEKVDAEVVFEFGGPWGVTAIMFGFPVLMFYLWGCLHYYHGMLANPLDPNVWRLIAQGAAPTMRAFTMYWGLCVFQFALAYVMPGPVIKGAPVPSLRGKQLLYLCNGVSSWYVILVTSFLLHHYDLFRLTNIIDEFGPLMTVAVVSGIAVTILIYALAVTTGAQHRMSGYLMYDLFMGAPLNPRIGHVDLKMFAEIRIPWVLLFYVSMSAAIKEYEIFGYVSASMIFMVLAHFLYVNACMKGEECIPSTWDMTYEKFGFMLIFWNLAGVPFTYCYSTLYLHVYSIGNGKPMQHSTTFTVCCFTLLLFGYYIWDTANSQKNRFRMMLNGAYVPRRTFPQLPWGTLNNPTYIKTAHGSPLLTGGWWGIARKIHYTADLMMAFSWAFITGFFTIIPFFYPVFFFVVLVHRVSRDMKRCSKKYGSDWKEYCRQVPYIFIPGVF